jgi:hypothetical protein
MASNNPNRPQPTGLPAASEYVSTIVRPDRPEIAPGGNTVRRSAIPATLDGSGAASRTSPLGRQTSSGR